MSFEIQRFVEDVRRAHEETDAQRAVEAVLARAVSEPRAVLAALGEPKELGPQPLYQSPDLTILNVVWAPLMVLLPHEHAMWASIGVYTGREDNITWTRRGSRIEASGAASLSEKQIFGLPIDAVHSVTNPIERLTGAIHIYGGDFFGTPRSEWDPDTLTERPFDLEAARARFRAANARFQAAR
jgi:predicted metal-dependent enzyme (double-stranded beta helix superfamily)